MWVEYVVGSLLCLEGFSPGTPVFALSSKTNIFKSRFDLDYGQALYHEPLSLASGSGARVPVFDIKFAF